MINWNDLRGYYPGDWVRPRANGGAWRPFVDWTDVFTGHRAVDRCGAFELYDAPVGIAIAIEKADKRGPFEFEGNVEGLGNAVHVWKDETNYHLLYYQSGRVAYAHSEDALSWVRPSLGLIEYGGSTDNNLVTDVGGDLLKAVFADPTAPPDQRFRAVGAKALSSMPIPDRSPTKGRALPTRTSSAGGPIRSISDPPTQALS